MSNETLLSDGKSPLIRTMTKYQAQEVKFLVQQSAYLPLSAH